MRDFFRDKTSLYVVGMELNFYLFLDDAYHTSEFLSQDTVVLKLDTVNNFMLGAVTADMTADYTA
jgi:hypothetical protein